MILVVVISWVRYFSYFMIVNGVAKMTITLFRMLYDTLSFFVILCAFLLLSSAIFQTLFRDALTEDAEVYSGILSSLRAVVDYFTGEYDEKDMGNFDLSHSIVYMVTVLVGNIFLLNYMVAIINTVYNSMIDNGDFYAIRFSYQFVSKYIKALSEKNGYEKLILFPPPLNLFCIPLIVFSPKPTAVKKISDILTTIFFWAENIGFIFVFMGYLFAIDMVLYFKIILEIYQVDGFTNKMFYWLIWIPFGFFYLFFINLVDTCTLFNILCFEKSVSFNHEEDGLKQYERYRFYVYRDCIRAMKQLYELADSSKLVIEHKQHLQKLLT